VIQNTQNRDGAAIQIKLDELIRAIEGAHNGLLDLEELSEDELENFRKGYLELAEEARTQIRSGDRDTGTPDVETDQDIGKAMSQTSSSGPDASQSAK
jgi:low affinity Fe/Cu permease